MAYYYPCIPAPGMQTFAELCSFKLRVEGTGRVKVQPDVAFAVLGVITENKQLALSQEENAAAVTAVLRTLEGMGVSPQDIKTQSFTVSPQYDYIEGRQVFRGYRVEHMLEIAIRELGRVGEIIDAAVRSGANQINSIRFSVSDPSLYYQQALNAAVDDAFAKVRTLGSKLNIVVLQVPVQIIEMGREPVMPVPLAYQASVPTTPVQAGMIEISARIEAIFVYKPVIDGK